MSSSNLWSKSNLDTYMAIRLPDVSTRKCMKNRCMSVTLMAPMQTLHDVKRALTESGQQAVAKYGVWFAVVMTK